MNKRNFAFVCIAALALNIGICATAIAQRGLENSEEFTRKVVSEAEDESMRQPSSSDNSDNDDIEWQDSANTEDNGSDNMSGEPEKQY